MPRILDARIGGAALALVVSVPLVAFLILAYPEYREALAVAAEPPSHEAIDGLFIGAAIRDSFAYQLLALTVVLQLGAAAALIRRWRWLLPIGSLGLFSCAVLLYLVGRPGRSLVLLGTAAFNVIVGLLSALAFGALLMAQEPPAGNSVITYAQVASPGTGIEFPRLTRFSDAGVMGRVNRQLDAIARDFGCHLSRPQKGTYYKVRSRVEYAGRDVFSISASADYDCGGPYPTNDRDSSVTFDLRTGQRIDFAGLFENFARDKPAILETIFKKQIDRAAAAAAAHRPDDGSCESDANLFSRANLEGSTFTFAVTAAGLRVKPEWAHAVEACAEAVVIPYVQLREYAAAGGVLERVER